MEDRNFLTIRHDWSTDETAAIYDSPFMDLVFRAQTIHRTVFDPNKVQFSRLLNIKTGGCPEGCGCGRPSAHHDLALHAAKIADPVAGIQQAKAALGARAPPCWRLPRGERQRPVIS